mmetsp:Transcript_3243/g.4985  ORF Transcript_3243/g.4985 Transcript_3243/m.4985 type:complete len:162 (+) Transcript_3243:394-879(+)
MNMMDIAWNEHDMLSPKEVGLTSNGIALKAPTRSQIDSIESQAMRCLENAVKSIVHAYKYPESPERRSLIEYFECDGQRQMSFLFKMFRDLDTDVNWVAFDDDIFAAMNRIYLKSISLSERCLGRYRKGDVCAEAHSRVREFLVKANAKFDVYLHLGEEEL